MRIGAVQFGHGAVQHFLGQTMGEGVEHGFHVFTLGQQLAGAGQFGRSPMVSLAIQGLNQGDGAALVQPVHEALHAGVDDGFGLGHGGLALFASGLHHGGEVIDGIEVDVVQTRDFGFDVARYRQVHHEHGAALAGLERAFNRTLERGEKLASHLGAQAIRLADLPERLHEFDIVVSCTASTLPIIGLGAVERALKARKRRPMFMVDLAVPRDIEPEVARLDDIYLYTVDDLSTMVQTAGEKRQAAVAQAEAIIDTGVQGFVHWLDQRSTVPLIQALYGQADHWRAAELARARKLLTKGEDVEAVLDALTHRLTQKMLHGAMAELHGADAQTRPQMAEALSRMFLRGDVLPPTDLQHLRARHMNDEDLA